MWDIIHQLAAKRHHITSKQPSILKHQDLIFGYFWEVELRSGLHRGDQVSNDMPFAQRDLAQEMLRGAIHPTRLLGDGWDGLFRNCKCKWFLFQSNAEAKHKPTTQLILAGFTTHQAAVIAGWLTAPGLVNQRWKQNLQNLQNQHQKLERWEMSGHPKRFSETGWWRRAINTWHCHRNPQCQGYES